MEEKTSWQDAVRVAKEELCKRKSSFKLGTKCSSPVDVQKPPNYNKMDCTHRCMDCGASFGVMKRRHHCRACGSVSKSIENCVTFELKPFSRRIIPKVTHIAHIQAAGLGIPVRAVYVWVYSRTLVLYFCLVHCRCIVILEMNDARVFNCITVKTDSLLEEGNHEDHDAHIFLLVLVEILCLILTVTTGPWWPDFVILLYSTYR